MSENVNVTQCIRKPDHPGEKNVGSRYNDEAWCGRRFDLPCATCGGKGRREDHESRLVRCVVCRGTGREAVTLEPLRSPASVLDLARATDPDRKPVCLKCINAVVAALEATVG